MNIGDPALGIEHVEVRLEDLFLAADEAEGRSTASADQPTSLVRAVKRARDLLRRPAIWAGLALASAVLLGRMGMQRRKRKARLFARLGLGS